MIYEFIVPIGNSDVAVQVEDETAIEVEVWPSGAGTSGTSGVSGTSGIDGTSGTSSTAGTSGTSSTSGSSGTDGSSGSSGSSGTAGTSGTSSSGTSGTSGINGTSGSSGTDGTSGADGASGLSGTSGTSGISGTSGTTYPAGTSGTSGISGTSGSTGTHGTSGTTGTGGTSGSTGTHGTSGTTGTGGSSGTSGINGTSGTTGTGGTSGSSGSGGTSGTTGTAGTSGTSGTSGINGTSGVSGTSGTSGIDGTSGISGTSGTSGPAGASGTSGTSGISGTSGTTSPSGTSGTSGISGTDGTSGSTGTHGTSGTTGTGGTSGTSGTSGIAGTSGTTGTGGTSGTSGTGLGAGDSPTFATVKLSLLADGFIPYHSSDAVGLVNSPIFTDGTNVGIGATTPDAKLTIQDVSAWEANLLKLRTASNNYYMKVRVHNPAAYQMGYRFITVEDITGGDNPGTERDALYLSHNGNVGIGTTNPLSKLDVRGLSSTGPSGTEKGTLYVSNTDNLEGLGIGQYTASPYAWWLQSGDNRPGVAINRPMALNPNGGNVGIGTTAPQSILSFGGTDPVITNATSDGSDNGSICLAGGGGAAGSRGGYVFIKGNEYASGGGSVSLVASAAATAEIHIYTGGYERLTISNNGNVGIGTVTPVNRLDVYGAATSYPSLDVDSVAVMNLRTAGHVQLAASIQLGSPYAVTLQVKHASSNGNAYPLALNPLGGNVGIGTTEPIQLLTISSSLTGGTVLGLYNAAVSTDNRNWALKTNAYNYGDLGFFVSSVANGNPETGSLNMLITASGNVGIGTTAPTAKLDVRSDINVITTSGDGSYYGGTLKFFSLADAVSYPNRWAGIKSYINVNTDNVGLGLFVDNGGASTEAMTLKSNGNVGIGTTDPSAHLSVTGNYQQVVLKGGTGTEGAYQTFLTTDSVGVGYAGVESAAAGTIFYGSTPYSTVFGSGGAHKLHLITQTSVRMTIDTSGNVGIGTTGPEFGVGSGLEIYRAGVSTLRLNNSSTVISEFRTDADATRISMRTDYPLRVAYISTDLVSVTTAGNVGIGTTAPGSYLTITNAAANTWAQINGGNSNTMPWLASLDNVVVASALHGWSFYNNATNGNLDLYRQNSSTTKVQVMSFDRTNGNVGIGTTEPDAKLTVNGSIKGSNRIQSYGENNQLRLTYPSVADLDFSVNAAGQLGIMGGNVGIGTTAPAEKLEVNGNLLVNGTITGASIKAAGADQLKFWTYAHTITAQEASDGHYHQTITSVTRGKLRGLSVLINYYGGDSGDVAADYTAGGIYISNFSSATELIIHYGASVTENSVIQIFITEAV